MALLLNDVYFDDLIPNWHITRPKSKTYIVLLAAQGQFVYTLDSATVTISKGEVLFIRKETVRTGTNGPFPPHQKYSAHFLLDNPIAHEIDLIANKPMKPQRFEYFRQRFALLFRTWRTQTPFREITSEGILLELLGALLDDVRQQNIPPHKWMIAKELEKYILAHFKEDIKIDQLAQHVDRTPNYVSTIFKEVTGQSPIEYVHQLRVSTAQDLLTQTNMSIAEISDYLGFCDPTYFNRVFKKICGQPPSVLMRMRRQL